MEDDTVAFEGADIVKKDFACIIIDQFLYIED
jgi:hypothetical protein